MNIFPENRNPLRSPSKAIILAAGMSSRLRSVTASPKTLLSFGSHTLLDRILLSCRKASIFRIVIVVGYRAEEIEHHLEKNESIIKGLNMKIIYNPEYEKTNNIYSFWLAKEEMNEDFVLFNSDVLFHEGIIDKVANSNKNSFLLIDDKKKLGVEDMKVILNDSGFVTDISKTIDPRLGNGEYIGIARFSDQEVIGRILSKCRLLLDANSVGVFYEEALRLLSVEEPCIQGLSTDGLPWIEIDTPKDYEKAKTIANKMK